MDLSMLDELMDEATNISGASDGVSLKRTIPKNNSVINFEINEEDNEIAVALKNLINDSEITVQEIYDIKGQRDGYNMIYSIKRRQQLGLDRLLEWCKVLNKKPVINFVDMTDEEIRLNQKELMEELNHPKVKRKRKNK